jgi:hypothetical protein
MPRPCQLPEDGLRRTITFRPDLDERLAVLAARRRVPISTIVEELIDKGSRPCPTPEEVAVEFPSDWDGTDLRRRLYFLRMRQTDLARALGIPVNTLNSWLCGENPFDKGRLPAIQNALKAHEPIPIENYRTGSRSPGF